MLVDIFSGRDRPPPLSKARFHFSAPLRHGPQPELGGERFTVADAWHRPDICYRGAKFAILVTDAIEPAQHLARPDIADAFG